MQRYLLLATLTLAACYAPNFVSGQVECGTDGSCPEGFSCRADNRCWRPGDGDGGDAPDLGAPPADLAMDGAGGDDLARPPTSRFLHVKGARIVDGADREVRLTGINWFGLETPAFAPQGLSVRPLRAILQTVKDLGYNAVRLPISSQLLDPASRAVGISATHNPDLVNLTGLQLLDKIVAEAGARGLRVILARHRLAAGMTEPPLWFDGAYPEARWISDWTTLAGRYRDNATVVAFDLQHEPYAPVTWGTDNMGTDLRLAAERAGRAVLAVHPEILLIVQGIDDTGSDPFGYWRGGNHRRARQFPLRLPAERVVYGANDYPASVVSQPWFGDANYPNNLPALWDSEWGYLQKESIAPVFLSGFGGRLESNGDRQWIGKLGEYIGQNRLSFAYWCLNPDGTYGGVLKADWSGVQDSRHNAIKPYLADPL